MNSSTRREHDSIARFGWLILLVLVVVAAALRLLRPGISPPGLNQDEAISAWISWCLLKTGHDMTGQPWPIFYCHGIGDNPSMLFFYTLMPFQALGGLSVWTTRLPGALSGVLCVPLLYYVASRLFGRVTGLVAAAMLVANPWHLYLSRFGVGASECPLLALIPLALMLRARLPLTNHPIEKPSPVWAGLAGIAAGVACYSFHPMRIYFPLFFVTLLLAMGPSAWRLLRDSRGRMSALALILGFSVTFGPLAWQHVVDPEIAHRWEMTRLWQPGASLPVIIELIVGRYLAHFSPDFLFARGDLYELMKPIGQGEFGWYMLPCMLAGAGVALFRARSNRATRVLLAVVLLYPVGDIVSWYISVHSLRSAPGVCALVMLGAYGAVEAGRWLSSRSRVLARVALVGVLVAALGQDARYLFRCFGEYNRRPEIYYGYHTDLLEAIRWLRPRFRDADAVFCTTTGLNEPFAISLVGLEYDPKRWLAEPRDRRALEYDIYLRFGKMHFMYEDSWKPELEELTNNGKPDRVLFIVRPGELKLDRPIFTVRDPEGHDALWICSREL